MLTRDKIIDHRTSRLAPFCIDKPLECQPSDSQIGISDWSWDKRRWSRCWRNRWEDTWTSLFTRSFSGSHEYSCKIRRFGNRSVCLGAVWCNGNTLFASKNRTLRRCKSALVAEYLAEQIRDNGWPFVSSPELGSFTGPGRREDPCPYATLFMTKLLLEIPEFLGSTEGKLGLESLLSLWERRCDYHPFIFYMGTDFCKLKSPEVWFDILHVLDVVSRSGL